MPVTLKPVVSLPYRVIKVADDADTILKVETRTWTGELTLIGQIQTKLKHGDTGSIEVRANDKLPSR